MKPVRGEIVRSVLRAFPNANKRGGDGKLTRRARKARQRALVALHARGFRVTKEVFDAEHS